MRIEIIGIALGLAGIIIGIFFSHFYFKKSLKVKEPTWAIRNANLIRGYSSKLNDLSILYKNIPVENLSVSKLLFWNEGKETIEKKDIRTINHLKIVGKQGVKFLDSKISASNGPSNRCKLILSETGNLVKIDFDYLDYGQGFLCQLVHTGTSPSDINIEGDIIGVKKICKLTYQPFSQKIFNFSRSSKFQRFMKYYFGIVMVSGIAFIILGILSIFSPEVKQFMGLAEDKSPIPSIAALCAFGILAFFSGFVTFRTNFKIPKGLEMFKDDYL